MLVYCTKCGHQVSTTAPRCPGCGAPGPAGKTPSSPPSRPRSKFWRSRTLWFAAAITCAALIAALGLTPHRAARYLHIAHGTVYFPVVPGIKKTYRLSQTGKLPADLESGESVVTTLPPQTWDGKETFPQSVDVKGGQSSSPFLASGSPKKSFQLIFYVDDGTGIKMFLRQDETDIKPKPFPAHVTPYILKYPIRVGTRWSITGKTASVDCSIASTHDEVIVPAGSFEDCARVHMHREEIVSGFKNMSVIVDTDIWFARRIGVIKTIIVTSIYSKKELKDKLTNLLELEKFELPKRS